MKNNALTEGSIFKTLLVFSVPMIVTSTVSILFHAADVAVLAIFADGPAVAAVGACGSIISFMVSIFTGMATGANVLIAKRIGARNEEETKKAIGTSLTVGFSSGVFLMIIALVFSRSILILMNCQPEVLDDATLYMQIYFLGAPIMMLNCFTDAALRSSGDSMRPMIYSFISGSVNVVANIIFVSVFKMSVDGVACASVLSSAISLSLGLITLFRSKQICRISIRDVGIGKSELLEIARVGVPTCFCSIFFYAANLVVASAVNSISTDAMTANAISGQFDGVIYTVGAAIASATSVMVAQNYGAGQTERIRRIIRVSLIYVTTVSLTLGTLFVALSEPLLGIMSDSPSVITIAKDRMILFCLTYFVTSIMEVFAFSLRALKRQKSTMVVGAICGFGIRSLWTWIVWPLCPTIAFLFLCYPVSALIAIFIYLYVYKKLNLREKEARTSPVSVTCGNQ